jgi:hypothetical protein
VNLRVGLKIANPGNKPPQPLLSPKTLDEMFEEMERERNPQPSTLNPQPSTLNPKTLDNPILCFNLWNLKTKFHLSIDGGMVCEKKTSQKKKPDLQTHIHS